MMKGRLNGMRRRDEEGVCELVIRSHNDKEGGNRRKVTGREGRPKGRREGRVTSN